MMTVLGSYEECPSGAAILIQFEDPRWPQLGSGRHAWLTVGFAYVRDSREAQLKEWKRALTLAGVEYRVENGAVVPLRVNGPLGVAAPVVRVGFRLGSEEGEEDNTPWVIEVGRPRRIHDWFAAERSRSIGVPNLDLEEAMPPLGERVDEAREDSTAVHPRDRVVETERLELDWST